MAESKIKKVRKFDNGKVPPRLRFQMALSKCLEEINPLKGYHYDLRHGVFRGRSYFGEEAPLPMVSILEAPIPPEQDRSPQDQGVSKGWQDMVLQGWVVDDDCDKNPTDAAHYLMAEVKARIAIEVEKLKPVRGRGGTPVADAMPFGLSLDLLDGVEVGPGVVRPADEISSIAYFWLTIRVKIIEDWRTPFGD